MSTAPPGKPKALEGDQLRAVHPEDTVWLSASAGTGKTHVLASRVLRLLLQPGVEPSQLLCLTFTKAGAAEMAVRVNEQLARWVRLDEARLAAELRAIGAPFDPGAKERARTLFTRVLDCPGGGLRIDTIHAFAQWLLSAFPEEAGLVPGARAMEDRERGLLARQVLADLLEAAERSGDRALLDAMADLSLRKGPDAVESWLMRCAGAGGLWDGPGGWQGDLRDRVHALLGLPADAGDASVAALCTDAAFDVGALRLASEVNRAWQAATGQKLADGIDRWLASDPAGRAAALDDLVTLLYTGKGDLRAHGSQDKLDPAYGDYLARIAESIAQVGTCKALVELAKWLTPALELGRKFAQAWTAAKAREGLIDFDDQIALAAQLLTKADFSDWIRYKLDRRFDHILVDEAQDTNVAQWQIILDGLAAEFFAGAGQRDDRLRTLFVVGDYKQAIFRFQGTSPENFAQAKERVRRAMAGGAENARGQRGSNSVRELQDLGLGRSFRTAQPVLAFVDRAIAAIGHESFGLSEPPQPHVGEARAGLVTLWQPVGAATDEPDEDDADEAPNWFSKPERQMAERIAKQVKQWLDHGFVLEKGERRRATAGDVMVLVRKRRELAGLIVARLFAHRVPVAGVDRLRLGGPLAVQDLLAALRFAAQPLDDLNLANLLVSPLIGWNQDELLHYGWRTAGQRKARQPLWRHLRNIREPRVAETLALLDELLRRADFEPPQILLHWVLVGPWRGRQRLVARLGREANDPIDELLNAALQYSATQTPSLQGFIHWFDADQGELKREQGQSRGQVRVMTVHGAKGLQAPIVILADATGNPDQSPTRGLELAELGPDGAELRKVPLPGLTRAEKVGPIAVAEAAAAAAEREEHWRLLYVAMTRAEEALFIGGALTARDKGVPAPDSWYARLETLFAGEPIDDPLWTRRRELGRPAEGLPDQPAAPAAPAVAVPAWARALAGPEPRPPRPLAPSSAGEDSAPDPPLPPGVLAEAALRGTLVHKLLERLPQLPPQAREAAASQWLARQSPELPEPARAEIAASALGVLAEPGWAELFGPSALPEVPLAATVGGQVIAGTVDRLLVLQERVLVVDFKTARRPPASLADVPPQTIRQMAAYVAALQAIYPGREVSAAVLYTSAPRLLALPAELLAVHKPGLAAPE